MLPHKHFLIAGAVIAPFAIIFFPGFSIFAIIRWILIGGISSASVDFDIYMLCVLKAKEKSQLRIFRNPLMIYKEFDSFMSAIVETGVLRKGMKTHFISSILAIFLFYYFANAYFVPGILGIISHLLSDIPYFFFYDKKII